MFSPKKVYKLLEKYYQGHKKLLPMPWVIFFRAICLRFGSKQAVKTLKWCYR